MVKKENANFSLPDVPPGFPFQPPKTATSAAATVDSSRNQSPTCKENGPVGMHVQSQSPDVSAEQPPRRTSRKRFCPQFYEPPTVRRPATSPRRRGRPSKARFMSQLSLQEAETGISNQQVSSTPLSRPRGQLPCFIKSLQMTKEKSSSQANGQVAEQGSQTNNSPSHDHLLGQKTNLKEKTHNTSVDKNRERTIKRSTFHAQDIEETLIDISLTEAPSPVSGCERAGNLCRNNQISEGIDPKILQHVANALQYMAGSQTILDNTKVKSRSSDIDKNLAHTLKAINKKHGDITQHCSLESECMKTLVLLGICKVVQDLQKKQLKDLDISSLDSCYTAVRDAESMKVNVQWLHRRLDEIKDAFKLTNEAKGTVTERNRLLENVDRKKKELLLRKVELERLKSEVQDIEEQLAQEVVMVEELNKKFNDQTSKLSQFQHTYLMDGLV